MAKSSHHMHDKFNHIKITHNTTHWAFKLIYQSISQSNQYIHQLIPARLSRFCLHRRAKNLILVQLTVCHAFPLIPGTALRGCGGSDITPGPVSGGKLTTSVGKMVKLPWGVRLRWSTCITFGHQTLIRIGAKNQGKHLKRFSNGKM